MTTLYPQTPSIDNPTLTEGQKVYFIHDDKVKSGRIDGDLFQGKYTVETRNKYGKLVYWEYSPERLFTSREDAKESLEDECPYCDEGAVPFV